MFNVMYVTVFYFFHSLVVNVKKKSYAKMVKTERVLGGKRFKANRNALAGRVN
jgi:hypothetical protein